MEKENRRNFLKKSVLVIPAAILGSQISSESGSAKEVETFEANYDILVEPKTLIRLDEKGNFHSATPWAISRQDQDLIPYLISKKSNERPNIQSLQVANDEIIWQDETDKRLANLNLYGDIPTFDIISEVGTALYEKKEINVGLNAFDLTSKKVDSVSLADKNSPVLAFPEFPNIIIPVQALGYRIQFRGPDTGHSMSPCAPEAQRHYHLEVFRVPSSGSNQYLANFHIAIFRSNGRICFALANNYGWPSCIRTCTPSYNIIKSAIQQALVSIGISAIIASVLAASLAAVLYGSIFVLAV